MKIILTEDDKKLGKRNSIITVKDGYGTYLINQDKAVAATKSNLKRLEKDIEIAKEVDKECRKLANQIKDDIESQTFYIDMKFNDKTHQLNGAITKNDVLQAIRSKYPIYIIDQANFLDFPKTKFVGLYSAKLRLYEDIVANVEFGVDSNGR